MKIFKILAFVISIFVTSSIAHATTYGNSDYEFQGKGQLAGTVPYEWYPATTAKIYNEDSVPININMTLRYGNFPVGNYQWTNDLKPTGDDIRWHDIPNYINDWNYTLAAGTTVWLRMVFRELNHDSGQWLIYHIQSPCPYGTGVGADEYYWAFAPASGYYLPGWIKSPKGNVVTVTTE